MNREIYDSVLNEIGRAEFVLVGIGEEFQEKPEQREQILQAYLQLEKLVSGKPYFILTQNEDRLIFESNLMKFFIAAPFCKKRSEEEEQGQWDSYLNWLTATLNHKLCILELGVGFSAPQVIRWPFERTAQVNFQSVLVRINEKFPQMPQESADRGLSVREHSVKFLTDVEL